MNKYFNSLNLLGALAIALPVGQVAAADVIPVTEDVMTSVFFQGANRVRGYAAESNRPVMRVSNHNTNGTTGAETIYLSFDYDFSTYAGPIYNATLTMQSTDGGFNANAGVGNPFLVSAHAVAANPFASITDDTNLSGPISWLDFYNNHIRAADTAARTSIDGFGPVNFNVTSIVNSWISGANNHRFIAMTGKNDTSGKNFLHGFLNNNNGGVAMGHTFLTVSAVPEPEAYAMLLAGLGLIGWVARRKKRV